MFALGALSFLSANPITLNRDQILDATDVLTVVVEDVTAGDVRVEKSWKDAVNDQRITLLNLRATKTDSRQRLLIPVTRSDKGWQITSSKLPQEPPLVYPATEESERQLELLLKIGRLP